MIFYQVALGQMVNEAKSSIFFSKNYLVEIDNIDCSSRIRYLIRSLDGKISTDDHFDHIATQLEKLVNGYTRKLLNSAGREVLVIQYVKPYQLIR